MTEETDSVVDVWKEAVDYLSSPVEQKAFDRAVWDSRVAKWPVLGRGLADSRDRVAWAKARAPLMGASDVAKFAKIESWPLYMRSKLYEPFRGNAYTQHGNEREPVILSAFGLKQNFTLYRSAGNPLHGATPDALVLGGDGSLILAQVKTVLQKTKTLPSGEVVPIPPFTNAKGFFHLPPEYFRQMQWEMYVMGADASLFIYEEHVDGVPTEMEPQSHWVYRDQQEIDKLIIIADLVLAGMAAASKFKREMEES